MGVFKSIHRVFCIEADKIEAAIRQYPRAFQDGMAVVTFNGVYSDDKRVSDYQTYGEFFRHFKALGIDMQVNLSVTLGHGDRQLPVPYPTMVDSDGGTCRSSACPRSDEFLAHLEDVVTRYAKLRPSVFWIDDDFRMAMHTPVDFGCFCPDCVARFNKQYGYMLSREDIRQAILKNATVGLYNIRKAWQTFNQEALLTLARLIARSVHAIDDGIIIGYMQPNPDVMTYGFPNYSDLIDVSKNKNGEVWFRHGSGFYNDYTPYGVVEKNFAIARLCALTSDKRYRVRNLTEEVTSPYTRKEKSMKITLLEAVMNIGIAGADGIMYEAIKPNLSEQLLPGAVVEKTHENYPWLSKLRELIEDKTQVGIYPYFSSDLWQYNDPVDAMGKMGDMGARWWKNLFYMGIPLTFRESGACALLLSGKTVRAMEEKALTAWLKKGIYADGVAAIEINRRISGTATGVKAAANDFGVVKGYRMGERFTDHPLNGKSAGYQKYNAVDAKGFGSAYLELDGGEALSYSMTEKEAECGIIGTSVYTNAFGGKTAVSSRGPWENDILSAAKSEQVKNIFDWLCGGHMPVRLESTVRVGQSLWESEEETIVFLYNVDFDTADDVRLILGSICRAEQLAEDGTWKAISFGQDIAVPAILPWSFSVIRLRKA